MYSSENIDLRNWVHLFESRCISGTDGTFRQRTGCEDCWDIRMCQNVCAAV